MDVNIEDRYNIKKSTKGVHIPTKKSNERNIKDFKISTDKYKDSRMTIKRRLL
ncbi:MAG: hypothetical protein LBT10_06355 [Methanobrevibacter sp.]|jgi:hypothetical protein|nr:hypothetical protein [Methanobrevibacter sp.]